MSRIYGSRLLFLVVLALFRAMLDVSYVLFVNVYFAYAGFGLDLESLRYGLSWFVYAACVITLRSKLRLASDFIMLTYALSLLAPLTSYYGLAGGSIAPVLYAVLAFGIVAMLSLGDFNEIRLPAIKGGGGTAVAISIIATTYLVVWYIISGAVHNFNLDLSEVYEYRDISRELANVGILAYFNHWAYSVFNIFCIAVSLHKRRYALFIVFVIAQIFFFAVSAHKSILFYPFLVLFLYSYFRYSDKLIILPLSYLAVVLLSLLVYAFTSDLFYPSLFIRRVFYVPAVLAYDYFHFFSESHHIYWSNSVLSSWNEYPYTLRMAELVGVFNGSGSAANNGFVSSGYAHAGVAGVVIYAMILGIVVRLINMLCRNGIPIWLALSITIVPLRATIISSDLLTTLMTHGLGVSVLLLFLARGGYMNMYPRSTTSSDKTVPAT